jgi:hypothetical protein
MPSADKDMRILVFSTSFLWLSGIAASGCSRDPAQEQAERKEAQQRFLMLVQGGLDMADPKEVTAAFLKSFRERDSAAEYSKVLATATMKEQVEDLTVYGWDVPLPYNPRFPDSTLRTLRVYAAGQPPRIEAVCVSDSED